MERELIETRYDWVCSQCGCLFFNRDWVIAAPTLMEMVQHYKKMQRQAFDAHVCFGTSDNYSERQFDSRHGPQATQQTGHAGSPII
jgi:hypothetical protein